MNNDLIARLRHVATTEYGTHTLEGLELVQAADMLERVQRTQPEQFGEASIVVAALALSALNKRQAAWQKRAA